MEKHIQVDNISVRIVRKQVRRMILHVTPEEVWLSLPIRTSYRQASQFIRQQKQWIFEQQQKLEERKAIGSLEFDGQVYLWGKILPCVYIVQQEAVGGSIEKDCITLFVAEDTLEERSKALNALYHSQMEKMLPEIVKRWETVVGQQATAYTVRDMRTRWGSCSVQSKRIRVNLQLARFPLECLDYVVVHELTHLLIPNHSAAFWSQVEHAYPDWRQVRAQMKAYII